MSVIAQIGCGYWGPNLLRNFSALSDSRVKWVAEASPQRRAYVEANYPRTQTAADWQVVMNDPEVEGVVIATPASTHYELAGAALAAGKHVFVEKPLALSLKEADELISLAAAGHRTLMVGHTFLYNAAVRYAHKLVSGGELGQLYYIYSQRLNLGQVRSDVNVWWNLAPHDLSILIYLMGDRMPVTIAARGVSYIQPGIEDVVFALLSWADGVTAHIQVSWLDPGKIRKVTLVGSRKMVVYDDVSDDKIAILDKGVDRVPKLGERMDFDDPGAWQVLHRTGDILLPRIETQEPLKTEAAHFLECVRTGRTPLTGPLHARQVVAALEAGQVSLREGGRAIQLDAAGRIVA
jgi:predicted dehydrogenase